MVGYPLHGTGPGGFQREATYRTAHVATGRRELGVHLGGDSDSGGGARDGGDVQSAKAKHGHAVNCYAIAYGPL